MKVAREGRGKARLGLAASLVVMWATPLHAQLATDTAELMFETASGDSVLAFHVTNDAAEPIEAAVYLGDWTRSANGDNLFAAPGSLPGSCHERLELFPSALRLPPGGSQMVRVALRDRDAAGEACWSIVFVESRPSPMGDRSGIAYSVRLGIKVYVLPPGLVAEGEVESAEIRTGDAGVELAWRFRNTGTLPISARPAIEIRNLENELVTTVESPEFPVLPGALREATVAVPALPSGRYMALVLVDYGGVDIAAGQADLEVR